MCATVRMRLPLFENVRYSVLPEYSQQEMVREVLKMDIGLFPLFHVEDSFTRVQSQPEGLQITSEAGQ